ncbi:MAG: aconitase X swivel domain-containing protein [Nitrososphaeraceae archaeon]
MNVIGCRRIVEGYTEGKYLLAKKSINFLSMVDKNSGKIGDSNHELYGKSLKNNILIFPNSVGSSVGAYIIYALKINNVHPNAIICTNKSDIITASGCAISDIPLVDMPSKDLYRILNKKLPVSIIVDANKEEITIQTI